MSIQRSIVSLLSEVHVIQNQLTQLTGVTLNLATLDILTISSTTGVISLTTSTVTVEEAMTESQKVIMTFNSSHIVVNMFLGNCSVIKKD